MFVVAGFVLVLMEVGQAFGTFFSLGSYFVSVRDAFISWSCHSSLTQDVPFRNLQLPRELKQIPAVAQVVGHSQGSTPRPAVCL